MKTLIVGDPHAKIKNLPEMENLAQFIVSQVKENKVDRIVLLGDLLNDHGVIRVEIQNFWLRWLKKFADTVPTIVIRGNHDQNSHQINAQSSLLVYGALSPNLSIVEGVSVIDGEGFVAYVHSEEQFKEGLSKIPNAVKTLWIHQTVDGSKYEGGFYAPDGFSLDPLKRFDSVISGHIHTHQDIANVWYPGTPKWDSKSDANEEKGLWILDSVSKERTFISTKDVVTPIYEITYKEEEEEPALLKTLRGTVFLNLEGSGSWISSTAKKMKGKYRIVPKPTDSILKSMESKQIVMNFDEFLNINVKDSKLAVKILSFVNGLSSA